MKEIDKEFRYKLNKVLTNELNKELEWNLWNEELYNELHDELHDNHDQLRVELFWRLWVLNNHLQTI
jgi:hypothetical protein